MNILQDILGLITKGKVKPPTNKDYIVVASYTDAQEILKPQPKMQANLVSVGALKTFIQSSVGSTPTLQEVANVGNTLTDTDIIFNSDFSNNEILINVSDGIYVKGIDSDKLAFIEQSALGISNYDGTNTTFLLEEGFNHTSSGGFQKLTFENITSEEEIIIPNASGTLALTTYKVYTALLKQTGTDDPTATVLENTLGGDIVWERGMLGGRYTGVLTNAFTTDKTFTSITQNYFDASAESRIYRSDVDQVQVRTFNGGVNADGVLNETPIEIRVYN